VLPSFTDTLAVWTAGFAALAAVTTVSATLTNACGSSWTTTMFLAPLSTAHWARFLAWSSYGVCDPNSPAFGGEYQAWAPP
jgi:hypothetical protein